MAKETLYNINVTSPVQVTRELYTNVGSGINIVGDVKRLILGSTDFEIWDSAVGGTQLTEGVDYQMEELDNLYSNNPDYGTTGISLYGGYSILNATYQTGNIYITYKIIGSYIDADTINYILNLAELSQNTILSINDSDYIIQNSDTYDVYIMSNMTTGRAITLPALSANQNKKLKIFLDSAGYTLTINPNGADTINGYSSVTLTTKRGWWGFEGIGTDWKATTSRGAGRYASTHDFAVDGPDDAGIVINSLQNPGNTSREDFIAFNAYDDGGTFHKISSISALWHDADASNGYAKLRFNADYIVSGTRFDNLFLVGWGNQGAEFFGNGTTPPGSNILNVNGDITATSIVTTNPGFQIGQNSKDISTGGSQNVTGFGFDPVMVEVWACVNNTYAKSIGIADGTSNYTIQSFGASTADTYNIDTTKCIKLYPSDSSNGISATISLISDGFSVSWTLDGSPTGTATYIYKVYR